MKAYLGIILVLWIAQQLLGSAGEDVLRARSHLLRSRIEVLAPAASADTRSGRPLPPANYVNAISAPPPCPRGRDVLSTCQHLRQDGRLRLASVASASASEGHPGPAHIRDAESQNPVQAVQPVLAFPDPELDDSAAYRGYQTRFYRDSRNNTVQIYLQPQTSRAVLVWADAANESVGFNVRDARGRRTRLFWGATAAEIDDSDSTRSLEFRLAFPLSSVQLG